MKESVEEVFIQEYILEYKETGLYGDNEVIRERKSLKEQKEAIEKLKRKSNKYHSFKIYEVVTKGEKNN